MTRPRPGEGAVAPVLLSEARHRRLLRTMILPTAINSAATQTSPVAVFIAGQPGVGKSRFAELAQHALAHRGGAVRICSDDYKPAHPCYPALLAIDDRSAGVRTRPDTRRWQAEVEDHTRQHRLDAVIETALADPGASRTAFSAYLQAGHRVELVVLAVPEAFSSLAVLHRYLQQARATGTGRYVSAENHDRCSRGLPEALRTIEAERLANRITVIAAGGIRYLNQLTPTGSWTSPTNADQVLAAERTRPWTANESRYFNKAVAHTKEAARHAPEQRRAVAADDIRHSLGWAAPLLRQGDDQPAAAEGPGRYGLPAAEHRRIFTDLILPFHLGEPEPRRDPVAVYVVGQPGAGKTTASARILHAMRPGTVLLSSEDFRAFHPDYARLLAEHPRTAGALLRSEYRAWQNAAEEWLRSRKADVVVEAAPTSSADLLAAANQYQAAGYRVEILVLAVRAADSRQGTAHRFALNLEQGHPARFTTRHGHDLCYRALGELATALDHEHPVHRVTVTDRDLRTLPKRPGGTAAALEAERQRPYTSTEAARFLATQRRLWTTLPQHRVELSEITFLAARLLPQEVWPRSGMNKAVGNHLLLPARG